MKKVKKKLLSIILILSLIIISGVTWLLIYLHQTDAPATIGKVSYHIPYHKDLTLDIYHPTLSNSKQPAPVLMYIHGGAWIAGSKLTVNNNRFNGAFNALRNQGYFIISPDYTLARNGKSPFPMCIEDIFYAIDWMKLHAIEYNWDMNQLVLLGESAGGHLAMMTAFSNPEDFGLHLEKQPIHALIDVYGPSDLVNLYHANTTDSINELINRLPASLAEQLDLAKLLVGFQPSENQHAADSIMEHLSPINYLTNEAPPMLLIHGKADQIVPVDQSYELQKRLDSLAIPNEAYYYDQVNHGFFEATNSQKQDIQKRIIEFISQHKP